VEGMDNELFGIEIMKWKKKETKKNRRSIDFVVLFLF
jgi:hypothetical protein